MVETAIDQSVNWTPLVSGTREPKSRYRKQVVEYRVVGGGYRTPQMRLGRFLTGSAIQ